MITETDENYLKETYNLQRENNRVTTSMLADRFGSSPATVTGMLKKLAEREWVSYEPYKGVTLTDAGRQIALEVIRHHRLIETFLNKTLGIPWDRVHEEAERLEHVLSEYLEDRIDEILGHPQIDPHGSPIPARGGDLDEVTRTRLVDVPAGSSVQIVEVSDRDADVLAHLDRLGIQLGTRLSVVSVEPIDELITIELAHKKFVIGRKSARHIFVKIQNRK